MSAAAVADRQIHGEGRTEQDWTRWQGWQLGVEATAAELLAGHDRLVVLAPHPDDEVLAAGGLIQLAAQQQHRIQVIGVTDGAASHPGSTRWPVDRLVPARRQERLQALELLGLPGATMIELDLPDGGVTAELDRLTELLLARLDPTDLVISPWRFDGHPDHESTAIAAGRAAAAVGARHLQAPIWGWHWADPATDQLPAAAAILIRLDEPARTTKCRAIDCFTSQLQPDASTGAAPILPCWALRRFSRRIEVLLA